MPLQDDIKLSSFLMAGYECADHVNQSGIRVKLLAATQHDTLVKEDYQLLQPFHIQTVREGIQWGWVERAPYQYNWDEVKKRIEAGQRYNIQQIWDICHMGIPDDLTPTHPAFTDRFCNICGEFVALWKSMGGGQLTIVPINEMGFLSWFAGDVRGTVPFSINQSYDLKIHFLQACMKGIDTIRTQDNNAWIMHTEPLINIVPPEDYPHLKEEAIRNNQFQFQAMDILCGMERPDLGGHPDYVDLMGVNFYFINQWEYFTNKRIAWNDPAEKRWIHLHQLLQYTFNRYCKPLVVAETSHINDHRAAWIRYVAKECEQAIYNGVDLRGLCIYPAIDRPDWSEPYNIHEAGLWGYVNNGKRSMKEDYAAALKTLTVAGKINRLSSPVSLPEPADMNKLLTTTSM